MQVSSLRLIPREPGSGREHTGMIKLPVLFKIRNICCSQDWLTGQVQSRLARAALINGLAVATFQGTDGKIDQSTKRKREQTPYFHKVAQTALLPSNNPILLAPCFGCPLRLGSVSYDLHWLQGRALLPLPVRWGGIVLTQSFHQLLSPEPGGGRWGPTMGWAQQASCLHTERHSKEIGNLFMSQDFCSRLVSTLPWIQILSNSLLLSLRLSKYQHPDNLLVSKVDVSKSLDSMWR